MRVTDAVGLLLGVGLATVTGADWLLVFTLVIGSAGLTGVVTAWLGVAKYRSEQKQQRIVGAVQVRTVAAEEAENAMRIMGDALNRVHGEYDFLAKDHARMREDLDMCLAEQRRKEREGT